MSASKTTNFAKIMLNASGWGDFPLISGYVETLDANDVALCQSMQKEGSGDAWIYELGWSRLVTAADIGIRYVQIDNGHHRVKAAQIASELIGPILVPVADRHVEEAQHETIRPRVCQ